MQVKYAARHNHKYLVWIKTTDFGRPQFRAQQNETVWQYLDKASDEWSDSTYPTLEEAYDQWSRL